MTDSSGLSNDTSATGTLNDLIRRWLEDFPCLAKLFDQLSRDPRCPSSVRLLAAGVTFFLLLGGKVLPRGLRPYVLFADVIVIIIACGMISEQLEDELWEEYAANCKPLADIAAALSLVKSVVGSGYGAVQRFVMSLTQLKYRGYTATEVVENPDVHQTVGDDLMAYAADRTPRPDEEIDLSKLLPPPDEIPRLMSDLE